MSAAPKLRSRGRCDREILGESAVYPGHAVTLAYIVTHVYDSLAEALVPTEHGWPDALGNGAIPGAGGNVHLALTFLQRVLTEGKPFDEAVTMADDWWASCDGQKKGGWTSKNDDWTEERRIQHFQDRWARGQHQADRFKEKLREKLATWR